MFSDVPCASNSELKRSYVEEEVCRTSFGKRYPAKVSVDVSHLVASTKTAYHKCSNDQVRFGC